MPDPRTILLAQSGDPGAILNVSGSQANKVAQSVPPIQRFGEALYNLLKQQQQLGTRPLKEQELNAQTLQAQRLQQQTPSELIGAAPSIQESARSAEVAAVQPTISGAQKSQQTFAEQIKSFGDTLGATRQFMTDFENRENKARDDARSVIKDAFAIGGADSLKDLDPNEMSILEKNAGYPKGYIQGVSQTLKERELELKKQNAAANKGLTEYQKTQTLTRLNENVSKNTTYSKTASMRNFKDNVIASLSLANGISDIAAINQFQKVIDEGAVTRDQDVVLIQRSQSLANRLQTIIAGLEKGEQLSSTQRRQMRELVEKLYTAQLVALKKDPYIAAKRKEAILNGIDPSETILGEIEIFGAEENSSNENIDDWEYIPDTRGGERINRIFG